MKSKKEMMNQNGPLGFVLFMAWFGALVYFVNHAEGFGQVLFAFIQACIWPAIVLYKVLGALGA